MVWTPRARKELAGAGGWTALGPTHRSQWQTRRSNEYRELLVLQSRKTVSKCSIDITAGLGAFGVAAIILPGPRQPRERGMEEKKVGMISNKSWETNPVHEEVTQRFGGGWIGTDFLQSLQG